MKAPLLALCGLLAAPAFSQPSTGSIGSGADPAHEAPQGATDSTEAAEGERRICRRIERSETRMASRRICMTREQWRQHDRDN